MHDHRTLPNIFENPFLSVRDVLELHTFLLRIRSSSSYLASLTFVIFDIAHQPSFTDILRLAALLGELCPNVTELEWSHLPNWNSPLMPQIPNAVSSDFLWFVVHEPFPDTLYLASPAFPALDHLCICAPTGHPMTNITTVLKQISFDLSSIQLMADVAAKGAVRGLIQTLSTQCRPNKLSKLHILERNEPDPSDPSYLFTLGHPTLSLAFRFRELRELVLVTSRVVEIDDGILLEMAAAWPKLHGLSINHQHGWRTRPRITLREAVHGDTGVGGTTGSESIRASSYPLFSFHVLDWWIDEESLDAVEAFFSFDRFPELEDVDLGDRQWSDDGEAGITLDTAQAQVWMRVRSRVSAERQARGLPSEPQRERFC
ncbi:hypothetical protein CONPUDRAFT_156555 [Coniophora puteana RWD-64-598 SS2]|uniref:F-box domain-containing protein n=1 Tax=Coniophora puteana (strain RWD-64-598) TaxID=741705 RepID=A0A5M3MH74_CONPW|nr:uncharacterized protein CONPUDRAFT_156555 [Coniophora puteana RWD-64-598 SS2]EIW78579.1 hypothetical protein CONPUDRAFT_156555 [Coniophora puteana RWD-64-598 SS2]